MIFDTTIGINKQLLRRLKIVSLYTNKKLYEVIEEAIVMLEEKHHIRQIDEKSNHE